MVDQLEHQHARLTVDCVMRSNVDSLLPIRTTILVTALHAAAGLAWYSNFYVRSVPGLLLFLMARKIQYGLARMHSHVGSFAGVHCSALRQTLRWGVTKILQHTHLEVSHRVRKRSALFRYHCRHYRRHTSVYAYRERVADARSEGNVHNPFLL